MKLVHLNLIATNVNSITNGQRKDLIIEKIKEDGQRDLNYQKLI